MISKQKWLLLATLLCAHVVHAQTVEYIHTDALGSPLAVTNASAVVIERTVYNPYGAVVNRPLTNGPGYTGHVADASTGLNYMQQRYYDPALGRFLSVDPVGPDLDTGRNFNRYSYADNNPYSFVDPQGTCTGSNGPKVGTCKILGTPQKTGTPGHDTASAKVGEAAARAGAKEVHYNRPLSAITGDPNAGQQRPDVTIVNQQGQLETVEVVSKSQSVAQMDAKGEVMQSKLPAQMRGGHRTVTVSGTLGTGKVVNGVGAFGVVSGLAGAISPKQAHRQMSIAEFIARAAGVYEIGVANGTLPPPLPEI